MSDDIEYLKAENAELRAIIRRMAGVGEYRFPTDWGLSPSEVVILSLLAKRGEVMTETIYDMLYHSSDDPPLENTIKVFISHIRRKAGLKGHVLPIWARGYRLTDDARGELQEYRITNEVKDEMVDA